MRIVSLPRIILPILLLSLAIPALAQYGSSVSGTIEDSSNAVIPNTPLSKLSFTQVSA